MNDEPLFNWFDDTDGFVNNPASRDRAFRESKSGVRNQRHKKISKYLDVIGDSGATWRELGEILRLHHGQISGALSKMHANGEVFVLKEQRDRCHPYVHVKYRDHYAVEDRFDEPVKTVGVLRMEENNKLKQEISKLKSDLQIAERRLTELGNNLEHALNANYELRNKIGRNEYTD